MIAMGKVKRALLLLALLHPFAVFAADCMPALCVVAPPAHESDRYQDGRTYLPADTTRYRALIAQALAAYPAPVQKQFCAFKKVYLEESFMGSAWSTPIDEKNPKELLLGLRKSDLDSGATLQTYVSWFQQQSFGGRKDFTENPQLPKVRVTPAKIADLPAVAYTLLHELGHSFDYQRDEQKSWKALFKDFKDKKSICLNRCKDRFLDPTKSDAFYESLHENGFLTQLAALNSMEDFAESFALYVLTEQLGADFVLETSTEKFSTRELIHAPEFAPKLSYLKSRF
jgi:hypothetical protein